MQADAQSLRLELGTVEDLPVIYRCLQQQFPPDEFYCYERMQQMLNHNQYKILLYRQAEQLVGYATVCSMADCQTLWLDLLAVLPQYQSAGFGGKLFEAIYQKYCGPFRGMLLCAERVDSKDPEYARQQQRRLQFYEKHGAYRLKTDFLLPVPSGGLPMYLYYKPHKGILRLSRGEQVAMITEMFDYCYSHMKHAPQLLHDFNPTITDEVFLEAKGEQSC